jgi:hypothetical protein
MELTEFQQLTEKIQDLIQFNDSLKEEKRAVAEKLILRERQIRELKERCERYERNRKESYRRISAILDKLDGVKP